MNYHIKFTSFSIDDLQQIVTYYDDINKLITDKFLKEFNSELDRIESNPFLFQTRYNDVRICFLKIFPIGIHFIVEFDKIILIGIFNVNTSPKKWHTRKKLK